MKLNQVHLPILKKWCWSNSATRLSAAGRNYTPACYKQEFTRIILKGMLEESIPFLFLAFSSFPCLQLARLPKAVKSASGRQH
jgi:hypothetical protein